ncbi:MAG TPA: ATP-binding protein [Thermoanaerobaculia bacterium]|jgi:serine/threonine-protein kinase RsbW|nr:ATP-binding protein [Thermoanaerobaculia bacterium]
MSDDKSFHLAIGSRFENIELVQLVLKDSLDQLGLDDDNRHWIDVAVREAVANAIKHGNLQDPAKQVHVDLTLEGGEGHEDWLVIRVQDEGRGFDPSELEDPLAPENLLKPNGRGIFYMKSFMDDIQYRARPGGGTVVTLRKRLNPPQPDDPARPARTRERQA